MFAEGVLQCQRKGMPGVRLQSPSLFLNPTSGLSDACWREEKLLDTDFDANSSTYRQYKPLILKKHI